MRDTGHDRDKRDKRDAAAQPGPGQTGHVSLDMSRLSRWGCDPGDPGESNKALADELAELRDVIRTLQAREAELRTVMLSDPEARVGKNHIVSIKRVKSRRVNAERLRRDYPDVAAVVTDEATQEQVWVTKR